MNTKSQFRAILVAACTAFATQSAFAFQDDYVWQERFKMQMANAEKGNADAQYDIGEMYEKGSGVATDAKKAFSWFEKSSNQGHVKAQFKVAYMYYKGVGVESNVTKAHKIMEHPANEGNVRAQFYLGQMYEKGDGVKSDLDEAFTWYSRSSLGGYKPADEALSELKKSMADRSRKDEETAIKGLAKVMPSAPSTPTPKPSARPKAEKVDPTPTPASTNAPQTPTTAVEGFQQALQTQPSTASALLGGTWMSPSKLPSEYLPSKITSCHKTSESVIECVSEELQRNVAGTDIVYQTKAIVYAMKKDGDFKIAYRNNVTKILNGKEAEEQPTGTGDTAGIKLGWQETEHRLECKVESDQTVNCLKNKTQKVTLKNQTLL